MDIPPAGGHLVGDIVPSSLLPCESGLSLAHVEQRYIVAPLGQPDGIPAGTADVRDAASVREKLL